MKYIIALLVILLVSHCGVQNNQLSEHEVETLMQQWLELWRSYDSDNLGEIFWDSPALTYFSSEKRGLIKGFDKLKPHHEGFGFVSGGKKPSKTLWLDEVNITLHKSTAVVDAIWLFGEKQMPKDSVQQGPCTFVIIRDEGGQAKIAHVHFGNY